MTTDIKLSKPVADLYEMQFEDGHTCAFHTDAEKAIQWLNTCDGNKVQEYVKLDRIAELETELVRLGSQRTSDCYNLNGMASQCEMWQQKYEVAEQRITELEASETQLIQERDSAEQALANMYEAAIGERPEWSNWFGFSDAVKKVAQIAAVSKQEKDEK